MNNEHDAGPIDAGLLAGGFEGCNMPLDGELVAEGWDRRCITEEAKSREMEGTYTELGFEVRLVPVDTGILCASCDGCKDMVSRFNAVYVRRPTA